PSAVLRGEAEQFDELVSSGCPTSPRVWEKWGFSCGLKRTVILSEAGRSRSERPRAVEESLPQKIPHGRNTSALTLLILLQRRNPAPLQLPPKKIHRRLQSFYRRSLGLSRRLFRTRLVTALLRSNFFPDPRRLPQQRPRFTILLIQSVRRAQRH